MDSKDKKVTLKTTKTKWKDKNKKAIEAQNIRIKENGLFSDAIRKF